MDDSADLREIYEVALENEGYEVRSASSGEEALEVVREWRPAVVVTDIFMVGMSGLELITRLRSDIPAPVPHIIAASGFPDAKDEAVRRGALQFATKPLGWDALVELVGNALDGQSTTPRDEEVERHRTNKRAVAEAALDAYLRRDPTLLPRLRRGAGALSRYLGGIAVVFPLFRQGRLVVCGSSHPKAYPPESEATGLVSLASDVIESNAKLLVPDVDKCVGLRRSSRGIRFLACVPLVVDGVSVGAECLLDTEARDFSISDSVDPGARRALLGQLRGEPLRAAVQRSIGCPCARHVRPLPL